MSTIIDDPVRGPIGLRQYDKNTGAGHHGGREEFAQVFLRVWCYNCNYQSHVRSHIYSARHSGFGYTTHFALALILGILAAPFAPFAQEEDEVNSPAAHYPAERELNATTTSKIREVVVESMYRARGCHYGMHRA